MSGGVDYLINRKGLKRQGFKVRSYLGETNLHLRLKLAT